MNNHQFAYSDIHYSINKSIETLFWQSIDIDSKFFRRI